MIMENVMKSIELIPTRVERKELLCVIAAATVIYAFRQLISVEHEQVQKEIPTPPLSFPIVGHMFSLGALPGRTFSQWHSKLGPILKIKMGIRTWVIVDDPYLAHEIFATNGADTSFRPVNNFGDEHYSFHGKGMIFSQPDGPGPNPRSVVSSIMGPKQIFKYIDSIEREANDLVNRCIDHTEKNGGTHPTQFFALNSINVMVSALFGKRFDSVQDPEFIQLSSLVEESIKFSGLESDLANFLPIFSVYNYLTGKEAKMKHHVNQRRNPLYQKLIKEAAAREGPNAVKSLLESDFDLLEEDLITFMSDLIVAGMDTVTLTLTWNVAIMCHYPDVQQKVFEEIDHFMKSHGRLPQFKEREELPYCISVIKECMRYKPTTPFGLIHVNRHELKVDGYTIPEGSSIISNMDSIHKRPEIYPEPEKFLPERFLNNLRTMQSAANGKIEDRDHYNFGWGRRICPGIHIADVEMFSAFVQIYSKCLIEPYDRMPDIEGAVNAGLVLAPHPFKVKFTKRSECHL
ncbi:hypothetical protein INT47_000881 [Mucor saturninus]|uniref:Cytochrome P450 n=1 Tax=Mucor saturninus TaxID=64648 RepID=A0A8H7VBH4_9FUNG|nr:hypothetical protein INT47_000881 [Mucor saturninus]